MSEELARIDSPPVFTDAEGRKWLLKLTLGDRDKILEQLKIDLLPKDSDPSNLTGLIFDTDLLCNVLWLLCRRQAADITIPVVGRPEDEDYEPEHAMTKVDFRAGMDANSLADGWRAVCDAVIFFTQIKSPKLAQGIEGMLEKQMKLVEAGADQMLIALADQKVNEEIQKQADRIGKTMRESVIEQLNSATGLQES